MEVAKIAIIKHQTARRQWPTHCRRAERRSGGLSNRVCLHVHLRTLLRVLYIRPASRNAAAPSVRGCAGANLAERIGLVQARSAPAAEHNQLSSDSTDQSTHKRPMVARMPLLFLDLRIVMVEQTDSCKPIRSSSCRSLHACISSLPASGLSCTVQVKLTMTDVAGGAIESAAA